jgi:alginate biosynthesis protein AlgX
MKTMYARHLAHLSKTGWEEMDLVKIGEASGLGADFFNSKDHHWSTQGSRVTADAIAALVQKWSGWAKVPKAEFELETREVRNPGSYRWVVLDRCGVDIPAEASSSYKAVAKAELSADALLGDAPPPGVVLIGTSQSRRQDYDALANRQYFEDSFAALLRSALQADVLNLAAAGGGTYTSIDGWLTSKEFQKDKPAVVVWEMNDSEGFEQPGFLRSMVPAVYGMCSKEDALAEFSGTLEGDIALAAPAGVAGTDYYVAMKFSDDSVTEFGVTFEHKGGTKDTVDMKRSPLLPNSGLFFTELSGGIKQPLQTARISVPAGSGGRLRARLCKVP